MSYVDSPATAMLATHCAACGLPLLDAKSVEIGLGPDCRKKHGFDLSVPEETRTQANKLVHDIALKQDDPSVIQDCAKLHSLGFQALADRIGKRIGCVRIIPAGDYYHVFAPYNESHVQAMRRVPGRRFQREGRDRYDRIPVTSRRQLWDAICSVWAGRLGAGPRGMFVIGA